jgi:hypothetical protein
MLPRQDRYGSTEYHGWGLKYKNHMIFAALQLVDFTTTYFGLRHGATEGSAIAVWSIHNVGLLPDLILCKLLACTVSWILPDEHYALKIMNVLYGILMIWNIHVTLRHLGL